MSSENLQKASRLSPEHRGSKAASLVTDFAYLSNGIGTQSSNGNLGSSAEDVQFFCATIQYRWIRLPAPGKQCPWSGLSRTKINDLILPSKNNNFQPVVKSASLRQPGQHKAARVIHLASLLSHLERCAGITDKTDITPKTTKNPTQG